mmetsp:Transcript_8448/g.28102  ORF Transcript_8448/g.28102 Transcript_8448/m.28102 type:complete len:400 (-) Transcript_8448:89-1288(-)
MPRHARGRGARVRRGLSSPGAFGRVEGAHRQAHHGRGQPGHRRERPRAGDGDGGAKAVLEARPQGALCLKRGRHAHRRGHEGARRGDDALPDRVQDLHDAGDDDQRQLGQVLAAGRARGRQGRHREALRGALHQRQGGEGVRHRRTKQHVWLLGLGGRSVLVLVGDRNFDRPLDRLGELRRLPRGGARDGQALPRGGLLTREGLQEPADGAGRARRLVRQLLRRGVVCDLAVRPVHAPLRRLPPAGRHGVQRQVCDARRQARGGRHGPDHLGRAGDQRAARFLPADPPGHQDDPVRLSGAGRDAEPRLPRAPPDPALQLLRADRGADEGQDEARGRGGARGQDGRRRDQKARAAQGVRGQQAEQLDLVRQADAAHARLADRNVRAQDLCAGRHLEHQLL